MKECKIKGAKPFDNTKLDFIEYSNSSIKTIMLFFIVFSWTICGHLSIQIIDWNVLNSNYISLFKCINFIVTIVFEIVNSCNR